MNKKKCSNYNILYENRLKLTTEKYTPYADFGRVNTVNYVNENNIWFIIPYTIKMKTDLVKRFYRSISKHFTKENKCDKIIINKTIRICFSVFDSLFRVISSIK